MSEHREVEAPFNMAIATLKRLDSILQQIKGITLVNMTLKDRQIIHLDLVKQFFINAIPLLDEDYVKNNKEKIMGLKIRSHNKVTKGIQKQIVIFDEALENTLDDIIIELQQKLKKFFMPLGKDPSRAIEFG